MGGEGMVSGLGGFPGAGGWATEGREGGQEAAAEPLEAAHLQAGTLARLRRWRGAAGTPALTHARTRHGCPPRRRAVGQLRLEAGPCAHLPRLEAGKAPAQRVGGGVVPLQPLVLHPPLAHHLWGQAGAPCGWMQLTQSAVQQSRRCPWARWLRTARPHPLGCSAVHAGPAATRPSALLPGHANRLRRRPARLDLQAR